jgi:hypothetical protein
MAACHGCAYACRLRNVTGWLCLGLGSSPPLGVIDLAALLDRVVEDVPDLHHVENIDLLPYRPAVAEVAVLFRHGADAYAEA